MTPESLPSETLPEMLREWSAEARVPHDLADRALRRRARRRTASFALAAGVAAVVVATGVLVPKILEDGRRRIDLAVASGTPTASASSVASPEPAPASSAPFPVDPPPTEPAPEPASVEPGAMPDSLAVRADPGNAPPKSLIAAGGVAVSAYYVWEYEKIGARSDRRKDAWFLYDPRTGGYERTDWTEVTVAPGMKYAAVLEGALPARRIGLLDMATRTVRWIDLDHSVARISWSPDGARVLATTYEKDPTVRIKLSADGRSWQTPDPVRGGFQIVDVASGRASYHAVPHEDGFPGPPDTQFLWSDDGTLVWQPNNGRMRDSDPQRLYYDLEGRPHDAPREQLATSEAAGLSPDGRLYADRRHPPRVGKPLSPSEAEKLLEAEPKGPETVVRDVATGKITGRQKMLQLLAWADDTHLIALQCLDRCQDEFDAYLALVTVDGRQSVRLSGDRRNSQREGSWHPVLTKR
ncbi:hypothetical protein DQ384_11220 [Sphaerisporangium album]|uniref:WD40 repeat domain-containing protein n=1 Tax=Sphaerisporangium album TaxID=509200 RepID=A0A367FLJ9_9ACTN|nr:hypothetical protein [Sphaerisporangium album]RCG31283.1 hypothetical protein DQ384_11220 [Sphaerisporangium album]